MSSREQDTKREAFFSSWSDCEPTPLLPCQALLWEVLSSLSPSTKKKLISREDRAFSSLDLVHKLFFSCGSLPWSSDSRNRLIVLWQAHGPLYAHFDSLIPPVLVYRNQWHNIRRHLKGGLNRTHFGLSFRSIWRIENFRWTCTVSLDTSLLLHAGSSVVVRCAGIDRTNQRSLDCCRTQNKKKMLEQVHKKTTLNRQNTGNAGRALFFCSLTERQNFLAAALFPSLTFVGNVAAELHNFLGNYAAGCKIS